MNKLVVMHYL